MRLTRRRFLANAAALGVGLRTVRNAGSAEPTKAEPKLVRPWNYVHVELGPGPWPQTVVADHIASLTRALQLQAPPMSISVAGGKPDSVSLPREFMITLRYADDLRVVFAARRYGPLPGLVTIRSTQGLVHFKLDEIRKEPPMPEPLRRLGHGVAETAWTKLRDEAV